MMLRWLALTTALALGVAAALELPAAAAEQPPGPAAADSAAARAPAAALDAQIDAWIGALAADEAFSAWQTAARRKMALGPGTHGWIVFLEAPAGGKALGYMIVSAKPGGGYALVEYGAGELPLFSPAALERSLGSDGLEETRFTENAAAEPLYLGPAHAVWKVSENGVTRYADAATGAWLPVTDAHVNAIRPNALPPESTGSGSLPVKRSHLLRAPADPYMSLSWLDAPDADIRGWGDFLEWFEARGAGNTTYKADAFDGAVMTPIGVAGYHWWPVDDGSIRRYVALDQEGMLRYVPLEALLPNGTFR